MGIVKEEEIIDEDELLDEEIFPFLLDEEDDSL